MAVGFAAESTAVSVSTDFWLSIIDRFRTMPIARTSVLTGTVAGSVIRTMLSGVLVVAIALALGFRSVAGPPAWIAAAGLFALLAFALTWLTVALGLFAKAPAGANGLALLVAILPFISSAFVRRTPCRPGSLVRAEPAVHPGHRHHARAADCRVWSLEPSPLAHEISYQAARELRTVLASAIQR